VFIAASRAELCIQHRGNFKSTPPQNQPQLAAHQQLAKPNASLNRTVVNLDISL